MCSPARSIAIAAVLAALAASPVEAQVIDQKTYDLVVNLARARAQAEGGALSYLARSRQQGASPTDGSRFRPW